MAVNPTPRLGLSTWSADTDPHPGRTGENSAHQILDRLVAIWAGKGLLSARPAAGVEGRLWFSTNTGDGGQLSVDVGDKWSELSVLGGAGTPPPPDIDGAGSEGVSQRAMRADAKVPLPLATPEAHGAMSSQDKALIDTATRDADPYSLPYRDSGGRFRVAPPTETAHVATMGWVRDTVGSHLNRPGELVRRWGESGTFHVPNPVAPDDVSNKRYVDSRASRPEWKTNRRPVDGLATVTQVPVARFDYRADAPARDTDVVGPASVYQVAAADPHLAVCDRAGVPERVRDRDAVWVLWRAVQELAAQVEELTSRLDDTTGEAGI